MKKYAELDLCEFLKANVSDARLSRLRRAAMRVAGVESAMVDLSAAEDRLRIGSSVGQLPAVTADTGLASDDVASIMASLFAHAVILYERSTTNRSRGRLQVDLISLFTPEQRAAHARLVDLRDKGLAHFGRTDLFADGPWARETVKVDMFFPKGMAGHFCSSVMNWRGNLVEDLRQVLAGALGRGAQLRDETYTELQAALSEIDEKDATFRSRLSAFPLDVDVFSVREAGIRRHVSRPVNPRSSALSDRG